MAPINYSIKNADNIVKFDGKVKNIEYTRLTAPGENFLSLILRVDFEVEKNGHYKTVRSVAKRLPLNYKKEAFDFYGHAMKNEIRWYSEIAPILKDFGKEYGITVDHFPEYFGSRFSLDSSKKDPDSDGVLFLENLIPQGYQNDDRYIGSDFDTAKSILKSLALFHALPIAAKEKKPELFQVIKDFLDKCRPDLPSHPGSDKDKKASGPPGEQEKSWGPPAGMKRPEELLIDALTNIPDFAPYLSKIIPLLEKTPMFSETAFNKLTKEPWNTITHNDCWVNNVMVKYRKGKSPLVKFVDFQMCSYGSYAKDLVFFLLTSIRNDITREHMDDLLRIYYEEFTSILRKINVNLELTYQEYLEEVRFVAFETEISHAISFSTIIFGEKGTGIDTAVEDVDPYEHMAAMLQSMKQNQKDKLVLIASEAVKRNWT